jgi:hypothetical protein
VREGIQDTWIFGTLFLEGIRGGDVQIADRECCSTHRGKKMVHGKIVIMSVAGGVCPGRKEVSRRKIVRAMIVKHFWLFRVSGLVMIPDYGRKLNA